MNIMQGVLILSTLLAVSVRSQNTVDSLFLQVSDMEDAGMIFAGSVAIKVSKKIVNILIKHWFKKDLLINFSDKQFA